MVMIIMNQIQDLFLQPVGVLEFIHHDKGELALYTIQDALVLHKSDKVLMII